MPPFPAEMAVTNLLVNIYIVSTKGRSQSNKPPVNGGPNSAHRRQEHPSKPILKAFRL